MSDFLRNEFPDIKLASELEKELAISDFINSRNFSRTHPAIKRLSNFTHFSDSETKELIEASINSQIYWIKDDPDVQIFITSVIKGKENVLEPELLQEFNRIYRAEEKEGIAEIDDIPF